MPKSKVGEAKLTKRHPFQAPFNYKRRAQADWNERRAPAAPEDQTGKPTNTADILGTIPSDWESDEIVFLCNWAEQVIRLHDTLAAVAADRSRLLWRGVRIYSKLRGALIAKAQAAERNAQKGTATSELPQ